LLVTPCGVWTAVKARTATAAAADNETMTFGSKHMIVVRAKRNFCSRLSICHSVDVVTFMSNLVSEISTCTIINHLLLFLLFMYKYLTARCLVYLTHLLVLRSLVLCVCMLLFQPMTPPRDTCFSDLLLTTRSVDNGGLKLCTVVPILSFVWQTKK
jgi:hypothetical protein